MRKIKSVHYKTGLTILTFSFLVTVMFAGILIYFQYEAANINLTNQNFYSLNEDEIIRIFSGKEVALGKTNQFISAKGYYSYVLNQVIKKLIPMVLIFFNFLIILSIFLWLILKKIKFKETKRLVGKLNSLDDNNPQILTDPALAAAYNEIKQKFIDNLNDYKRLNSYLSHEQKNAIAILRTNLELSGHTAYLKNLDNISASIDDVLTLSENEDMSTKVPVDVSLVCALVCDNYKKLQKNISFDFDETDDAVIVARERWIYRAVANLVDNAIKYGAEQPITVSVKVKKGSVIVCVHDNGIGISSEKQELIFGNRYRVNQLNKDGYGIGLSLVSHVCDLCGGFVTVDSGENAGTTFYLSFPQKSDDNKK